MTAWAWRRVQEILGELAGRIASGELAPGSPVPTEEELKDTYGIQPAQAYWVWRQLQMRRLAHMIRGRILVAGPPPSGALPAMWIPPVEERIAEVLGVLADRIRNGEIAVHEQVGPQQRLRSEFEISHEVATEVRYRLEERGWAYSIPFRGTFAAPCDRWPMRGRRGWRGWRGGR
ncbi:hypothetical protein [Acrocarpospora sp. B8E8]|uniref:hypothetical protein n=1 Tax=Acrocarpospora sp. B8E8 TaxID=3153572 RepID=UPI00325D0E3D